MATIHLSGSGNPSEIAALLTREVQSSGFTCELIDSVTRTWGGMTFTVLVFEKYYMRTSNRASLTVVVSGANGSVAVDAIGAAGGQNALFRFSWGADENFAGVVAEILRPRGFR